jgi:hypothetical protein
VAVTYPIAIAMRTPSVHIELCTELDKVVIRPAFLILVIFDVLAAI